MAGVEGVETAVSPGGSLLTFLDFDFSFVFASNEGTCNKALLYGLVSLLESVRTSGADVLLLLCCENVLLFSKSNGTSNASESSSSSSINVLSGDSFVFVKERFLNFPNCKEHLVRHYSISSDLFKLLAKVLESESILC